MEGDGQRGTGRREEEGGGGRPGVGGESQRNR